MTATRLVASRIEQADRYLQQRTGTYEQRCHRYDAALAALHRLGLDDGCTVLDVGSGWGEFGARLHTGYKHQAMWTHGGITSGDYIPPSRARYWPVDAALDGTDLETWSPPRDVEYVVALEILEHLELPFHALNRWRRHATRGVVLTTPNPAVVDVLGMCSDHRHPIEREPLEMAGFTVTEHNLYGTERDGLLGVLDLTEEHACASALRAYGRFEVTEDANPNAAHLATVGGRMTYTYQVMERGNLVAAWDDAESAVAFMADHADDMLGGDFALFVFDDVGVPLVALVDAREAAK